MSAAAGRSLQERAEEVGRTTFLGCPAEDFESGGRLILDVLKQEGLVPSSRLLDVGCGAMRLGYWAMRFLDPGHYFGIEPNVEMRDAGLSLLEPEVITTAQPRFSENDDFDLSVFGETFDFVVAWSIWTHASKQQISAMLASFATTSTPDAVLMSTYRPPSAVWARIVLRAPALAYALAGKLPWAALSPIIAKLPSRGEYEGEDWVGRSHASDTHGVVPHSLRWIAGEASRYGLRVQLTPYPVIAEPRAGFRQRWLRVRHK